jgi:hypothetical protein
VASSSKIVRPGDLPILPCRLRACPMSIRTLRLQPGGARPIDGTAREIRQDLVGNDDVKADHGMTPGQEENASNPGQLRGAGSRLEFDIDKWKIPVRVENLEPPLLLAQKCLVTGTAGAKGTPARGVSGSCGSKRRAGVEGDASFMFWCGRKSSPEFG